MNIAKVTIMIEQDDVVRTITFNNAREIDMELSWVEPEMALNDSGNSIIKPAVPKKYTLELVPLKGENGRYLLDVTSKRVI